MSASRFTGEPLSALVVFVRLDSERAKVVEGHATACTIENAEMVRRMIDFYRQHHPSPPAESPPVSHRRTEGRAAAARRGWAKQWKSA